MGLLGKKGFAPPDGCLLGPGAGEPGSRLAGCAGTGGGAVFLAGAAAGLVPGAVSGLAAGAALTAVGGFLV